MIPLLLVLGFVQTECVRDIFDLCEDDPAPSSRSISFEDAYIDGIRTGPTIEYIVSRPDIKFECDEYEDFSLWRSCLYESVGMKTPEQIEQEEKEEAERIAKAKEQAKKKEEEAIQIARKKEEEARRQEILIASKFEPYKDKVMALNKSQEEEMYFLCGRLNLSERECFKDKIRIRRIACTALPTRSNLDKRLNLFWHENKFHIQIGDNIDSIYITQNFEIGRSYKHSRAIIWSSTGDLETSLNGQFVGNSFVAKLIAPSFYGENKVEILMATKKYDLHEFSFKIRCCSGPDWEHPDAPPIDLE